MATCVSSLTGLHVFFSVGVVLANEKLWLWYAECMPQLALWFFHMAWGENMDLSALYTAERVVVVE